MKTRAERIQLLRHVVQDHVMVLDGAMGTMIEAARLEAADYGAPQYEGCFEQLTRSRPDVIRAIHDDYLNAGADIIETNTFGATPLVLAQSGLQDEASELNREAARLARAAADAAATRDGRPRFVAASMGPTTHSISVTGGITFDALVGHYVVQAAALYEGGADYFLIETAQDTLNIKAALMAIDRAQADKDLRLPVAVSCTLEPSGLMLAGQTVDALVASLDSRDLLYIGLNCALGPEMMLPHARALAAVAPWPVALVPNAGLPDENGAYGQSPQDFQTHFTRILEAACVNLIGGCCGTGPDHIRALRRIADRHAPRARKPQSAAVRVSRLSGIEALEISDDNRPILIGERTNIFGSRAFKELIGAQDWEAAAEVAKAQVKNGAGMIDVCLADPNIDEAAAFDAFMPVLTKKIRVPVMIDSIHTRAVEAALKHLQGKAIINSINLENGEKRFAEILPLARAYGAAVVVGTIDDDPDEGIAISESRKIAVAQKAYDLLTRTYGLPPEDIFWDTLVFSCASGDAKYVGAASQTIRAITALKKKFPGTRAVLGVSNVSFGLPKEARKVLNTIFLHHATQAGLDAAIVNTQTVQRYASIDPQAIQLAEDLIWGRGADPVGDFVAHFKTTSAQATSAQATPKKTAQSCEARIAAHILDGTKSGLEADLDEMLQRVDAVDIINTYLMSAMNKVGERFNRGELIVTEVLQSAEAMRAACDHLRPHLKAADAAARGTMVLATVKGDVHDIGKNLVDIIFSNNGFRVINLGIQVTSARLIEAVNEHRPDLIGLSGLLVKSAHQMAETAADLAAADIRVPMVLGGAALTRGFVEKHVAPKYDGGRVLYAKDAMHGLQLALALRDAPAAAAAARSEKPLLEVTRSSKTRPPPSRADSPAAPSALDQIPVPLDIERHFNRAVSLGQIWPYMNIFSLYNHHLKLPAEVVRAMMCGETDTVSAHPKGDAMLQAAKAVAHIQDKYQEGRTLGVGHVYRFFKAAAEGDRLFIFDSAARDAAASPAAELTFPRQNAPPHLCLADYFRTRDRARADGFDYCAMFVVTAGARILEDATTYKLMGDFVLSHVCASLAVVIAEAHAEYLHALIRAKWGFSDTPETSMAARLTAKYRGKRYAFGYAACPKLEDQRALFALLKPEDVGVTLTDHCMMNPEDSVSGLIVHHPEAEYFKAT